MSIPAFPPTLSPLDAERPQRRALVSLTPLIDVVFILLVFFMLASNFLDWRELEVATPAAARSAPAMEGALLVELRADGSFRLGGSVVSLPILEQRVAERLVARPNQRVVVKPQQGVPLQVAIDVLESLRRAGASDLSLLRDPAP